MHPAGGSFSVISLPKFRFRFWLGALILAALLPAAAVVGFTVWRSGETLRLNSLELLATSADVVAYAVANELKNQAGSLRTIARGPERDGVAFTVPPPGSARSSAPPVFLPQDVVSRVRESGRPAVTNMLPVMEGLSPKVALVLPDTSGPPGTLIARLISPEDLIRSLHLERKEFRHFLIAVTDGNGVLLARSRGSQRHVGHRVPDWDKLQAANSDHGVFEGKAAEGHMMVFAFHTIDNTPGWAVVVAEPLEVFNARWQRPLSGAIVASLLGLVIAGTVAVCIARQTLRPVQALAQHAEAVGSDANYRGRPARVRSPVLEFEQLRQNLVRAEAAQRRRARAERRASQKLADSERRYRALASVGALVFWRSTLAGEIFSATGWTELTGQPEETAFGESWLERVHPEDRPTVEAALVHARETQTPLDIEFRIRPISPEWRWVRARGAPVADTRGVVDEWVGVLEDVDERRQAEARIAHMAHHDALTGLANRTLFKERLEEAITAATPAHGALLYLDLDRFKEVNDTYGHPTGDALLQAVAERLRASVRETDTVARLGGDEFAIIQTPASDPPAAARELAARLIHDLCAPFEILGHRVTIGTSIGIALIRDENVDEDQLMRQADLALYEAKQSGRGQFRMYEPRMEAGAHRANASTVPA